MNNNLMIEVKLVIPSKKIQINDFEHELVQEFVDNMREKTETVTSISIQGNSYSLEFCKHFAEVYLAKSGSLKVFLV